MRCYSITTVSALLLVLSNAHGFLQGGLQSIIARSGSLNCTVNPGYTNYSDFQLCAIRQYQYLDQNSTTQHITLWNGMSFTNIFRRFIKRQACTGFTDTSDVGFGDCQLLSYENFTSMTLCICAQENCNRDLETCRISAETNALATTLPDLMNVPPTVNCTNTSTVAFTCSQSASYLTRINNASCQSYVRESSVLCAVESSPGRTTVVALTELTYERFLDERLRSLKNSLRSTTPPVINETDKNLYINIPAATGTTEQCICTTREQCNYNITTCAPQIVNQGQLTTTTQVTADTSSTVMNGSTTVSTEVTSSSIANASSTSSSTTSRIPFTEPSPVSSTSTNSTSQTVAIAQPTSAGQPSSNTNLIIGLSVGIGGGVLLIVAGILFSAFVYPKWYQRLGRSSPYRI